MKKMDEHSNSCVAESSREPDMVLYDHQSEGELPTQVQTPLDIKNLGDPPPPRPGINTEETVGATTEGTGPGAQAPDQDIADICIPPSGDPSLQDGSYIEEEDPSPPHSLSSLNDNVTYLPPAGDAGGDIFTQILFRPKNLSSNKDEVRFFDPSLHDKSIEEEGEISLPLSLSSLDEEVTYQPPANNTGDDSGYHEFNAMGMERENIKYDEGEEIFSRPKSLSSNEDGVLSRAPDELYQVRSTSKIDSTVMM
ncbi:uncharacterized protein LOC105443630 [Strongylocentrotus purpuratus]|uniref:Uncharacterized protein n=1 Tax=Strongylocentrotus purpuratus TaxID=7668 RepID=A0A7M7HNI6_STRPU|nr:uncharacterized protein LOC105443630 [Strongylocentrotus purpuratus]|eukprot:XP_011675313.1 PREDICTED: uncharacterized protein LOC105443630 [Strongylocentrotus purpuratus]